MRKALDPSKILVGEAVWRLIATLQEDTMFRLNTRQEAERHGGLYPPMREDSAVFWLDRLPTMLRKRGISTPLSSLIDYHHDIPVLSPLGLRLLADLEIDDVTTGRG